MELSVSKVGLFREPFFGHFSAISTEVDSLSYYRKNQEANIVGQVGNMRTAVLSKRWRF